MDWTSAIRLNDTTTSLHVQRSALAPTNRDLSLLLRSKFGREVESFETNELALARVVFAQVALMAGAALVADSETFVGAEKLWLDMQDRIGPQERALAKHFLVILSKDEYYSETERHLIGALGRALVTMEEQPLDRREDSVGPIATLDALLLQSEERPLPGRARFEPLSDSGTSIFAEETPDTEHFHASRSAIKLDDATTSFHVQRASLAPSNRELGLLVEAKFGRSLDSFKAHELTLARVVFAQVALMAGAALVGDSETYMGAEQLWRDMLEGINPRERALAKHFLDLLSNDEYYSESERHLIGALSTALAKTEEQPLRGRFGVEPQTDAGARSYTN